MKYVRVREDDIKKLQELLDVIEEAPYTGHPTVIRKLLSVIAVIERITRSIRKEE